MVKIFVYGTLKREQPNFHELSSRNAVFIDEAVTVEAYPLIIATDANLPFLLYKKGHGKCVKGEIYEVDDATIEFLDWFEYLKENIYSKLKILVKGLTKGDTYEVNCYMLDGFKESLLTDHELLDDYDTRKLQFKYNQNADTPDTTDSLLRQLKNL